MPLKRVRILIDATTVTSLKDGLSQYIISLIDNLPESAFDRFEFMVLLNKKVRRPELLAAIAAKGMGTITVNIAPIGPRRDWGMFWFLKQNSQRFDLFHSTSNQYPLFLKKGIATIHDITFRKYFDAPWWSLRLAQRYLNVVIKNALKKAVAIIAVSESTKNDVLHTYAPGEAVKNKMTVIHEGWEHVMAKQGIDSPINIAITNTPYLLYVGSSRKHKNIFNLLKAYQQASHILFGKVNLVVCGNSENLRNTEIQLINTININGEKVILKGLVSETTLETLYRNADAFIFPSFSEGFGIPILEAFFLKTPLLCSNTSSFPEIAGDAAVYFNPHDVTDIANAIVSFYQDPNIRVELLAKGEKRLQYFSWRKMAEQTVAVYEKCVANPHFIALQN